MAYWQLLQYKTVYDDFRRKISRDDELCGRLDQRLMGLAELGNQAGEPHSKVVGNGIFECRASSAQHRARLLFGFLPGQRIAIVIAVLKDQTKLDPKDVRMAESRLRTIKSNSGELRHVNYSTN